MVNTNIKQGKHHKTNIKLSRKRNYKLSFFKRHQKKIIISIILIILILVGIIIYFATKNNKPGPNPGPGPEPTSKPSPSPQPMQNDQNFNDRSQIQEDPLQDALGKNQNSNSVK